MNVEQPKNSERLKYVDRLIMLNNSATLIGRVLIDDKYKVENAVAVYRPLQIFNEEHDVFMRKWIPPSQDDVFIIPMAQILTMATPNPLIVKSFSDIIAGTYNEYIPVDEAPEESEQDLTPDVPTPKGKLH